MQGPSVSPSAPHPTALRRIAWVTPDYPPDHGGVSDHSFAMVSVLRAAGHDVLVLATPQKRGFARLHADLAAYGPDLVIVAYTPLGYAARTFGISPAFTLWCAALRKRLGCRVTLLAHEASLPVGYFWQSREFKLAALAALQVAQFSVLAASFDTVLFSNSSTRLWWAELLPRLAERFHTIRICSNIPVHFSSDPEAELAASGFSVPSPTILFFGTGHPSVLFDYVEEAFRALLELEPSAGLVIVGMNAERLRELRPTLAGLGAKVQALGYLPAEQVSLWLRVAKLVLAPLIEGISARKGTVMAALQHGQTVITTRGVCTLDDVAWSQICLLAPLDRRAFADAAVAAFRDPERGAAVGRAARSEYDANASATVTASRILEHANRPDSRC